LHRDPRPDDDDSVPADDAIIGRAFRRSLIVISILVVVGVLAYLLATRRPAAAPSVAKEVGDVTDRAVADAAPGAPFVDVTRESGIGFVHANGAEGEKLLPETMGGGVAVLDYDRDGDPDLLFVGSTRWPGRERPGDPASLALYRNDGAGRFADVTAEAGLAVKLYGMGAAVADYDGDGDVDLFVTALGPNRLFENRGGRFHDVTDRAGVAGAADAWSTSAGFFDADRDGDLDLFVCNYVQWSREIDVELNFTLNGRDRAYGPPTSYRGAWSYLYRNDGAGRFTDVSEDAGLHVVNPATHAPMGKALALVFTDTDRDGAPDVFVANDTVQNFLFHNRGDGTFEEIGATSGVGFDPAGNATGAMGIDAAYYRNDDQLAVAIGNFANEMTSFYVAQAGGLQFTDEAIGEGIGAPSRLFLKFGLFFFDYDLDGRLDMLEANGHLENEIAEVQAGQTYRQPAQLFWNAGPSSRSCYVEVPRERTGALAQPIVGRGAAYADIDADGDLDVVLVEVGGPPKLLRNDQTLGHHWLRVKLTGPGANRDAIGAWVEIEAAGGRQRRQVMPTRSYLSQVELPVTFGLGKADRVDAARVVWPDGQTTTFEVPAVDRLIQIQR
jgi:enediyne biosynthesis protein E4